MLCSLSADLAWVTAQAAARLQRPEAHWMHADLKGSASTVAVAVAAGL